jgi:hypothetical protein
MEQAAEERSRVGLDDVDLPRLQRDGSFVLASRAVMREDRASASNS